MSRAPWSGLSNLPKRSPEGVWLILKTSRSRVTPVFRLPLQLPTAGLTWAAKVVVRLSSIVAMKSFAGRDAGVPRARVVFGFSNVCAFIDLNEFGFMDFNGLELSLDLR